MFPTSCLALRKGRPNFLKLYLEHLGLRAEAGEAVAKGSLVAQMSLVEKDVLHRHKEMSSLQNPRLIVADMDFHHPHPAKDRKETRKKILWDL